MSVTHANPTVAPARAPASTAPTTSTAGSGNAARAAQIAANGAAGGVNGGTQTGTSTGVGAPGTDPATSSCGTETRGGLCQEVQAGDTLASIAESTYGDASYWEDIVTANPTTVHDGGVIVVGEVLDLPAICIDPSVAECREPDPEASRSALTRAEWFEELAVSGDVAGALDQIPWMTPDELDALSANPDVLAAIGMSTPMSEAIYALDTLGAPTLEVLVAQRNADLEAALTLCDPLLVTLLANTPDGAALVRQMVPDNATFATFLYGYSVAPHEQVLLAGFDMSAEVCSDAAIDADLLVRVCSNLPEAERQEVLLALRRAGAWEQLVGGLGADHVALVQGWIGEDAGDDTGQTLDERVDAATNSDRARDARARVAAVAAQDTHQPARITDRITELLVLGVALPAIEGSDLATEGVLGAVQAERAAQALIRMPDQEYLRTIMLLELSGDTSRLTQSFLMLKAVAARADRFTDADANNDHVKEVEGFSDRIRDMDTETAVTSTSVTQRTAADTGIQQTFTMSCGPTAGLAIGAEADPIRGLELDDAGYSVTDSGGDLTSKTETALENHASNTAILRPEAVTSLTDDLNAAIATLTGTTAAADLLAVQNYISNSPFDQAAYNRGIAAIRKELDRDGYPNDMQMRLLRETAGGGQENGLNGTAIATEYNNDATMDADSRTGATYSNNAPAALGSYRGTLANQQFPPVIPENIATQVDALLATAAGHLEDGLDVGFGVQWTGGGGHAMTFTNVRGSGAARSLLIHDPWTGNTTWVTQANLRQANLGGVSANRGLVYRLAEPTMPAAPAPAGP